ncbi:MULTISPECIES: hypothetical protein [unclassified Streptomyces]|uniref:Rv1733c family protein n=1 Tax=unclassified Streptomyces TaxID=2593676 RepID=UPI001587F24C|nr:MULTISPECIES: hypothetical protein [unclassified Streptomyces]
MYAAATGLWRWRGNPLRRTTDLLEAWTALAALLLICLGAPVVGWLVGASADGALQESARLQQERRRQVVAEVLGPAVAPGPGSALPRPASGAERQLREPVDARWAAPGGTERTGVLSAPRDAAEPGDTLPVFWLGSSWRVRRRG